MRCINRRGHEIGLHPSYETSTHSELVAHEGQRLLQICKKKAFNKMNGVDVCTISVGVGLLRHMLGNVLVSTTTARWAIQTDQGFAVAHATPILCSIQ